MVRRALKDIVLSYPNPGGFASPSSSVLSKPLHLRMDKSCQGDIMALWRGVHILDSTMGIVISSRLTRSCFNSSCKISDYVLKVVEVAKFGKDKRSCNPIASFSTMRFIPLALNHLGLRGPHFQADLKKFATILATKPEDYSLLHGPFALTHSRVRVLIDSLIHRFA